MSKKLVSLFALVVLVLLPVDSVSAGKLPTFYNISIPMPPLRQQ